MTYLLDTMVLSEVRKRRANPNVLRWLRDKPAMSLFVSAITVGEIERGIELKSGKDANFAAALRSWLEQLVDFYQDRILPVDALVARRWGRLTAQIGHTGVDLLIAATALEHGLIMATHNVRHFGPAGVATENPFE